MAGAFETGAQNFPREAGPLLDLFG
jgi:hypothetical protein